MNKLMFRELTEEEYEQQRQEEREYDEKRERLLGEWRADTGEEYRPTCKVEDHTWRVEIEDCGGVNLTCKDPHPEEEIMQMDGRTLPGCTLERDYLTGVIDDVKLEWHTESYGDGYGGVGDYDAWAVIKEGTVKSN